MTLTLRCKASPRSLSNLGRTNCSGRGDGACSLGLMTILGGSTSGSREERIASSSIRCHQLHLHVLIAWTLKEPSLQPASTASCCSLRLAQTLGLYTAPFYVTDSAPIVFSTIHSVVFDKKSRFQPCFLSRGPRFKEFVHTRTLKAQRRSEGHGFGDRCATRFIR
jgi:hypothetical protein